MAHGRFITLEGGEGTGKSTQARLLAATLAAGGVPALCTREPGGTPGAEILRRLLLGGGARWSGLAETLLHFAARADHVAGLLQPALDAGIWIVSDRFADSTMAYQGHALGTDRNAIATLARLIGLKPDLTLVLDLPVTRAMERLRMRGGAADRYESLGEDFFNRIHDGFLAIAAAEPERCVVINGDAAPEMVASQVLAAVRARLAPS
jgi:dTMP kinase